MANLPSARFNLKSPNAKKETLVFLVYRYRGKRVLYSTGITIRPKDWDFKSQRPFERERRSDLWRVREQIDALASSCKKIYIDSDFGAIPVKAFKYELDVAMGKAKPKRKRGNKRKEVQKIPNLLSFIDMEVEDMERRNMRRNSIKTYKLHAQVIKEFAKQNGGLDYQEVDWNFRLEFIDWLADRNVQLAYGNKTLSVLRQFLERARRMKYHSNTHYQGTGWAVTRKKAKGQTLTFTVEELEYLYEHPFQGFLGKVRDLFLIGAATGQRFSDFSRYTSEDFYTTINGIQILSIISQKTDTPANVPLNIFPWLIPVLEKYDYASPALSMQKFNEGIKEVCKKAGFDQKILKVEQYIGRKARIEKYYTPKYKEVSSHTCRRSFATNLYRMGYTLAQIMPMTGHSTESQLRDYIGIDGEQNAEAIAMDILQRRQSIEQRMIPIKKASNF